ncbi:phospholipase C type enzyme [Podila epigama]|nr:phospholipase C type enzyme [Podila epigama]
MSPANGSGLDIVALQEVWMTDNYEMIKSLLRYVFPYSRHWGSGVYGSGLAIFSKYPIVHSNFHRYILNGDPTLPHHGDWYDGKGCSSVVIMHPTCGEIQVLNTHMHACYDQPGSPDAYLGTRVSQGWEVTKVVRQASELGRHVLLLGDLNSAPDSLVVKLVTQYGDMTDCWNELHPAPSDMELKEMTIDEQILALGITCDTPANTWNETPWTNCLTGTKIGERLDYIFYRATPSFRCTRAQVVLREPVESTLTRGLPPRHCSDHFGVYATFALKPQATSAQQHREHQKWGVNGLRSPKADVADTLESVLMVLGRYQTECSAKYKLYLVYIPLILGFINFALLIGNYWMTAWWQSGLAMVAFGLLSIIWTISFLYGFIYASEQVQTTTNIMKEVSDELCAVN